MSVLSSFWCSFKPKWETTTSPWWRWCSCWALTCQPSPKHSGFFTRKLVHPPSLVPLNPLPLEISGYSSSGQALSKPTGSRAALWRMELHVPAFPWWEGHVKPRHGAKLLVSGVCAHLGDTSFEPSEAVTQQLERVQTQQSRSLINREMELAVKWVTYENSRSEIRHSNP